MSYQQQLKNFGYARIDVHGDLLSDVKDIYYDICRYFCILVKDSGLDVPAVSFSRLVKLLAERASPAEIDEVFQPLLLEASVKDRKLLGKLYDIGTRPMKLYSGEKIFHNRDVRDVISGFFSSDPEVLLVKPTNGETLHLFPPGPENFKFNLPVHQDFPYLMQSPSQLTFWLNLTNNQKGNAGGIRVFPGTHHYGIPRTRKDPNGHFEVEVEHYPDFDVTNSVDSTGAQFELFAVDSLTWHSSLRNTSSDAVRLTYIFRVSNIGAASRVRFGLDALQKDCPRFDHLDFTA